MATLAVTRRHDLTDAQWAVLAPLLPAPGKGRPPKWTKRQLIDGIRWRIRVGAPWRDVPEQYAPWQTIYGLFRRWQRDGTWSRLLAALQAHADAAARIDWDVSVDSTISRAHQHAAGARRDGNAQKEPPGGVRTEPADHALGRSRGGLTTKTHLACEQGQKPLSLVLTAGQRGDSPQFTAVLDKISVARLGAGRPRTRPDRVLADKAYTSKANRKYLRRRGIKACIPSKTDQNANRRKKGSKGGRPPTFDPLIYQQRHAVECGITGRTGGTPPSNIRDAIDRLESAGASKKDIATFKKDVAADLDVTVRTVQRMTTRSGRETRSDRRHADRIRDFVQKDRRVREASGSRRRKSRMKNKGAKLKIKGRQGPKVGKSWPTRDRLVELDLDPYEMEAVLDAWDNDDAALEALQDALEDEGFPLNWSWEDGTAVEFLGLSRE